MAPFLTPGSYDVTVRTLGFKPLVLNNVRIQITEADRLKIQWILSGAKEQITVDTKPALPQTENATLG